tara:strand:- start:1152 stop:1568 length:417 start_codon:yes stop_codon:yes gene_type:complete
MTWIIIVALFLGGVFLWTENQKKTFDSKDGVYNQTYWNSFYFLSMLFICGFFFTIDYCIVAFTTPSTELNYYGFLFSHETIFYKTSYESWGNIRYADQVRYEFRLRNPINWCIVIFLSHIATVQWKKEAIKYQKDLFQ